MGDSNPFANFSAMPGPHGLANLNGYIDDGTSCRVSTSLPGPIGSTGQNQQSGIPGRAFFFVVADEVLPSGKVVRKVLEFPTTPAQFIAAHPEIHGIDPPNPASSTSLGEHALGDNQSRYTSASTKPGGAPNIDGRRVYIDINKAKAAGVLIHTTEEVVEDLSRIAAANPQNAGLLSRISRLKQVITTVEGEVLLENRIPPSAIKSQGSMTVTKGLRAIQFVGIAFTTYDLTRAGTESLRIGSTMPIAAETIRQIGGWGFGWAGMKIGFLAGAAVGIETGPGAIITGGVGALIFGTAGYFGADWVADFVYEN